MPNIPRMGLTELDLSKNWNFVFRGPGRPFLDLDGLEVVPRVETRATGLLGAFTGHFSRWPEWQNGGFDL